MVLKTKIKQLERKNKIIIINFELNTKSGCNCDSLELLTQAKKKILDIITSKNIIQSAGCRKDLDYNRKIGISLTQDAKCLKK